MAECLNAYPEDRVRGMLWELAQRPGVKIGMWADHDHFSITDARRVTTWYPRTYSVSELAEGMQHASRR